MIIDKVAPAFIAYALACIVLVGDMLFLWVYSGLVRVRSGVAINPEDAARLGIPLLPTDPPEVARVLRAHANAQAAILPFLLLGLVFVLIGGPAGIAMGLFAVFTLARIAHSVSYLRGKQPWRTLFFAVGGLTTVVLAGVVIWRVILVSAGG